MEENDRVCYNGGDRLQGRFYSLLAQQLAERVEDDAIADAEEEVEWRRHDALGRDGEQRLLAHSPRVLVCGSAIASGGEEAFVRDDADGAGMRGRWRHEAQHCVDEWPVAVEKSLAHMDASGTT